MKKQDEYFVLFERMGQIQKRAAELLFEAIENTGRNDCYTEHSAVLEHEGDATASLIFLRLSNVFIAPLDRDEIYQLTHALDDVIDKTDEAISNLRICNITEKTAAITAFASHILKSAELLAEMLICFSDKREHKNLDQLRQSIHLVESVGDETYVKELTILFSQVTDPIAIRKNERMIESLEKALDIRQRACDILMNIYLKWS